MIKEVESGAELHTELILSYLRSIPDPIQRAQECVAAAEDARRLQGSIADIRRHALYEATLRPGASGESVAAELGVTPKTVSQATATYRRRELKYLKTALFEYQKRPLPEEVKRAIDVALKSRDVVQTARTIVRADADRHTWDLNGDQWQFLDEAERRARHILDLARVDPERPAYRSTLLSDPTRSVDYTTLDPYYRWPVMVLDAMPGIAALGHRFREHGAAADSWMLSWQILPALAYTTVFETGPHRDGWAVTEWLIWFTRDLARGGFDVQTTVTSPPPYLNQPGESLSFQVFGTVRAGSMSATEYADKLISTWDADTGFMTIPWPQKGTAR